MQTQAKPRFRQDLMAELVEDGEHRFIDVADPDSGHMFRFFEVEYSIACAMDGERDVAGIVKWATDELGITPSPAEVQHVIATLAGLQFIGDDQVVDQAATKAATTAPVPPPVEAKAAVAPKKDDALAAGVVVPKAASGAGRDDVELGKSGTTAPAPKEEKLPVADFDLGAPGAAAAKAPAKAPVDDIALGAPGASTVPAKKPAADISLDLAAEMPVKAGDVKEAVRQSKVMTAVEVPPELLAAEAPTRPTPPPTPSQTAKGDDKKSKSAVKKEQAAKEAAEKEAAATVAAAAAPKVEPKKEAVKAEVKPEPVKAKDEPKKVEPVKAKDEPKVAKPAVALPKTPIVEKTPVAPPAPNQGVSPVLIAVLILAVVAAGAYLAWKFLLAKPDEVQVQPTAEKAPLPPPPPAEVTTKVALETPPAMEVKAGVVGQLETIEAADKDVKAGDVVATLVGAKPIQTELANLQKQIDAAKPAIETAEKELADAQQKEGNEAGVKAAQAKVDRLKKPVADKEATLKTKQGDADKLSIKSTGDGKLVEPLKVGDKVTADQVVAKVARPTQPVATFKLPPNTKIAADGSLSIVVGDKTIVCKVSDAQAETVKVTCPSDVGLTDGADAKFTLPK